MAQALKRTGADNAKDERFIEQPEAFLKALGAALGGSQAADGGASR